MFNLAASSLNHALETLTSDAKKTFREQVYSIPGLNLNTITKNSPKIVQNLLDVELKDKNNVLNWHDVMNHSISRHKNSGLRSLSVNEILAILNQLEHRLRALVYCHCDRTSNIFDELKKQIITVWNVEKDFVSSRKQKDQDFMKQFRALHQSLELDLKLLHILLCNDCDSQQNCPKGLSKRARKALKNASSVVVEE